MKPVDSVEDVDEIPSSLGRASCHQVGLSVGAKFTYLASSPG